MWIYPQRLRCGHTLRMVEDRPGSDSESERKFEELASQVAITRAEVDALAVRADAANHRAEATETAVGLERGRIDDLEAQAAIDREMIAELRADGIIQHEHVTHLEAALRSSRKIGAALGIVMATHKVSEATAFGMLIMASQQTNRKLRVLAEEILLTGDAGRLPRL